jgi:hypothetical protein
MSPALNSRVQLSHIDEACFWRGRYIEEFAMAEVAVSETLAALSALASSGAQSLLPTAVGQRFEALQAVVGPSGPLASIGSRAAKALNDLCEHRHRRNFLCHSFSEVSADEKGGWRVTFCLTSFRAGAIERSSMHITAAEASILLDKLRSARIRLDGQLRGMLVSLMK